MWIDSLLERHVHPLTPIATGMTPSGRLKGPVRCLMLDIYGTVLISGSGDIGERNLQPEAEDRLHQLMTAHGITGSPSRLTERFHQAIFDQHSAMRDKGIEFPEIDCRDIWAQVLGSRSAQMIRHFAMAYELVVNPVFPMPGAADLLDWASRNQIRMGIVSNAQFYTPPILAKLLGAPLPTLGFDPLLLVWSYRLQRAKPSPFLFQHALAAIRRRRIRAEQVLYVGNDMQKDVWCAAAAGFQTVLFAGDARSLKLRNDQPAGDRPKPDAIVTHLQQVADRISEVNGTDP